MARTFRLTRAGGHPPGHRPSAPLFDEPIVEFAQYDPQRSDDCAYSVVIGNNGSGKSRLLGNIANEFVRFHRGFSGRGRRSRKIRVLDYVVDGRSSIDDMKDVWAARPSVDLFPELPSRLIAVALTVVDKFPLEPSGSSDDVLERNLLSEDEDPQFYCYVGMRDRTNRASISALIYRAIDGLDRARSEHDNARLSRVFDLLGYAPEIQVRLGLGITPDVAEFALGKRDLEDFSDEDTRLLTRLRTVSKSKRYSIEWLRRALFPFVSVTKAKTISYSITFDGALRSSPFDKEALRLLRRLGALTLKSVIVRRNDGVEHDLRDASSGQITMLTVFLSVAANLQDGSLILIDEPETSLHPDWQSRYIHLMREVFSNFRGCHFVFSTHSPLIVADMPEGASVYSMDRRETVSSAELIGRSPDYVMARAFDVVEPSNLYLRDVLAEALRLVGERQIGSEAFDKQLTELVRLSETMDDGEQVKRIVKDLQDAKAELSPDGD
jgi:predicted ATPase